MTSWLSGETSSAPDDIISPELGHTDTTARVCVCFSVKGPELLNMYVGQSEENIREGL